MSSVTSPISPSVRSRLRRPALFASAGLLVAALAVGAPLAANALPVPALALSGTTMSPYGAVEVKSVTGFGANDALTFTLDGTDVTAQLVTTTTDATGSIPFSLGNLHFPGTNGGSVGTHTLVATDATASVSTSVTLQVIPSPVATPLTAKRTVAQMKSSGVTVRFSGFLPGDSVTFGMANRFGGGECGVPVTADGSGNATATCVWNAAYVARFGSTPAAGQYTIGGGNALFTIYSDAAIVDVAADPAAVTPVATPPAATPAVPVAGDASFTG